MPRKKQLGFILFRENSRKRELGFTLIELIIVIALIAILMTLIFVSFTQVQRNSRDAQRKSDLQVVAGILQRFYSDNSQYPQFSSGRIRYRSTNCLSTGSTVDVVWGTGPITCTPAGFGSAQIYTKQLPSEPLTNGWNQYCYETAGGSYNLYAQLEGTGTGSYPCNGLNYNYRVTAND